ncbi:MAG: hypothetical protein EOO51_13180 [Flavobacterium sp.]|nr:MAG: hypothetical protein EOO51_13180 [Flavobacterium sp.]
MKKFIFNYLCLLLLLSTTANAQDAKATKIIEEAIKAMGGKELLMSISTLYTKSSTTMEGHNVQWITKEMTPNKGSFIIEFEGRTIYKSFYDGQKGYELVDGKKQLADQSQFDDKQYRTSIFNEIDYLNPTFYKLEFVKEEMLDGKKCNKLQATLKNGKVTLLYYDTKSKFLVKSETVKNGGSETFSVTLFENYKKFGDLFYFSRMVFPSNEGKQVAEIEELYYNKGITQQDFE